MDRQRQKDCNRLEEILRQHDDRSIAILSAAYIENLLDVIITHRFVEGWTNKIARSFYDKIEFVFAVGIMSKDECDNLHTIRGIRNEFAHRFLEGLSFDSSAIKSKCGRLAYDDHFWVSGDQVSSFRDKFISSACIASRCLLFREYGDRFEYEY